MSICYDLGVIETVPLCDILANKDTNNIESLKSIETLKIIQKRWRHREQNYSIIKYDKQYLSLGRVSTIGQLRSVICNNNEIVSFSPPKSHYYNLFKNIYSMPDCVAEEFVEGTMINLFFDKNLEEDGDWEISTRSTVGGRVCYFKSGEYDNEKSFRYLFLNVCEEVGLNFDVLPKEYCYSFVFQHPDNRIVIPFTETNLYLIKTYKIDEYKVTEIPTHNMLAHFKNTRVKLPKRLPLTTFENLENYMLELDDYKMVGVVIYHEKSGVRTKCRNAAYEEIRRLRGNQPKLQYRYLELRNQKRLNDYLYYFPEAKSECAKFKGQLYDFTRELHTNYIRCYIQKRNPLIDFPHQYKNHMFKLHKTYLEDTKKIINFTRVKDYINDLPVASLMYSLNYNLRQQVNDCKVADKIINP